MARNGAGTYTLPSGNPVVTGTTISSTVHNNTMSDIAAAITGSIAADGQTPVTANIPMNSKKITGLAAGTTNGDALSYGQSSAALTSPVITDPTLSGSSSGTVKLSSTGVPYGSALHNNGGAVTGTANQYICSGTYTPTVTAVSNCSAPAGAKSQWMRVGNVVTVSGQATVTVPGAGTTIFGVSLPIASNLAATSDLIGAFSSALPPALCSLVADTTNDRAQLTCNPAGPGAPSFYFTFTYEVL